MKLLSQPIAMVAIIGLCVASGFAARADEDHDAFIQTNLTSGTAPPPNTVPAPAAANTDNQLLNAWGVAFTPAGSPFWIADNNAGLATLYDGTGVKQGLVVTIPGPTGSAPGFVSAPTGLV
jgi:hypothetical protein